MDHKVTTDYTRLLHNANVKVYVRARPCADGHEPPEDMFERKREAPKNIVIKDTERMQYGNHAFSFDNIYWTDTTQPTLYDSTSKVLVDYALKGINSCCFAYGQTGSGKTFSIFGEPGEKAGLLPRSIEYLFDMIERSNSKTKEVTLVVSFLEIYCDRVRDLAREYLKKSGRPVSFQTASSTDWFLRQRQMNRTESASSFGSNPAKGDENDDYEKANFEIHEDAQGRVFVKDLAMATVTTREEVDALVQAGLKLRATHETKMNAVSSRSHTVFTIHVFQQNLDTEEIVYGQLNMVDLAGSERLKKSESDGQRLKEALHINSSLSAVGKVVMSLDPESGYNYIPYRDSKLTRLLQNSIGGNSYTILIATIHPMKEHYEECLSTLQFANRCRSVQNQPRVNHINGSVADKDRRIRKLQEELATLRRQLEGLRAEYNNRFLRVLNEFGFDAEEVTESGEIKFADGMVLKSVFSNGDDAGASGGGSLVRTGGLSPLARLHGHGQHHANHAQSNLQLSKKDRDQLREKYANAKTNFSVAVTEAKKDKEESRKAINEMRRRITQLEDMLAQKSKEFEHALAAEKVRHRSEIQQLLVTSTSVATRQALPLQQQQQQQQHTSKPPRPASAAALRGAGDDEQTEQRHRQRVVALEQAKSSEIALIRQQYEHAMRQKHDDVAGVKEQLERVRSSTTQTVENLRGDCAELYAYAARLQHALEQAQRGVLVPMPKNMLADQHKLRNVKALLATDTKRHLQLHLQQAGVHMPGNRDGAASESSVTTVAETVLFARPQDDQDNRSSAHTASTGGKPIQQQRPVSAPVKRSKPTTYPSMLRDKVRDQPTHRR